jgi:hypothetical protein
MASLRSSFSRMVEEPLDGRDKVTNLEWLALKGVEPGVRNLLPPRLIRQGSPWSDVGLLDFRRSSISGTFFDCSARSR